MSDPSPDRPADRVDVVECAAHGAYDATLSHFESALGGFFQRKSTCPTCKREALQKQAANEEAAKRRLVAKIRAESGVPARFAGSDFDRYQAPTPPIKQARDTLSAFAARWQQQAATGQSLLLVGGPGTGKTHLAAAVVNAIADNLVEAAYGTAAELVGGIKSGYGKRGGDQHVTESMRWLQTAPLLVIDELDVGLSEHDLTLLFRVIDSRYADLRPMILISNRPMDQLEQLLGQRVIDRLRECAFTVNFDWPSHRGAGRRSACA